MVMPRPMTSTKTIRNIGNLAERKKRVIEGARRLLRLAWLLDVEAPVVVREFDLQPRRGEGRPLPRAVEVGGHELQDRLVRLAEIDSIPVEDGGKVQDGVAEVEPIL